MYSQTRNLILVLILLFTFTVSANQNVGGGDSKFLNEQYTGSGSSKLEDLIAKLIPDDVSVRYIEIDAAQPVKWKYEKQSIYQILNNLSSKYNFQWELIDDKLSFNKFSKLHNVTFFSFSVDKLLTNNKNQNSSQSTKTGDIKNQLGINSPDSLTEANSRRVVTVTAKGMSDSPTFEMTAEDQTLSLTLRRWAASRGYQLIWDAEKDFNAIKTTYSESNLMGALEHVMDDTSKSSYPLHACTYKNNVIRVLSINKSCDRTAFDEKSK